MWPTTRRSFCFAILAVLLLGLQQRTYVHPLSHLAPPSAGAPHAALCAPAVVGTDCLECALLTGGFSALECALPASLDDARPDSTFVVAYAVRARDAVAWFHSRAPPVLC